LQDYGIAVSQITSVTGRRLDSKLKETSYEYELLL